MMYLALRKLKDQGHQVMATREPGGTPIGEQIRAILANQEHLGMDSITELFLLEACRRQSVIEVVTPALEKGEIVLCDRYADSSLAYQGYGGGIPRETVRELNSLATGNLLPDLTFLLDVSVEVGLSRKHSTTEWTRWETKKTDYHKRVRSGFLRLASQEGKQGRWVCIDGSMPVSDVWESVWEELSTFLAGRGKEGNLGGGKERRG